MIGYQRVVQLIGFQWRIFKKSLKLFFCYPGIVYFYLVSALTPLGPPIVKIKIDYYVTDSISHRLRIISGC